MLFSAKPLGAAPVIVVTVAVTGLLRFPVRSLTLEPVFGEAPKELFHRRDAKNAEFAQRIFEISGWEGQKKKAVLCDSSAFAAFSAVKSTSLRPLRPLR